MRTCNTSKTFLSVASRLERYPSSRVSQDSKMSGVIFSDTFYLDMIDYDPVKDRKEKKFDKGTPTFQLHPTLSYVLFEQYDKSMQLSFPYPRRD